LRAAGRHGLLDFKMAVDRLRRMTARTRTQLGNGATFHFCNPDEQARAALQDCKGRVGATALIHEMLYQSRSYAEVPFAEYARSLAANVFELLGTSSGLVSLEVEIGDVRLPIDKAIPCGLIMNELITNALKHAFLNNRRGAIRVEISRSRDDAVSLSVRDNGVGLPVDFDVRGTATLGMSLIRTLADQLDGER
jgi:hypothetical protein